MSEQERDTRIRRIDPKLIASGWAVARSSETSPATCPRPTAVTELPTHDGPADYALCAEQRILAVVEAKKLTARPRRAS